MMMFNVMVESIMLYGVEGMEVEREKKSRSIARKMCEVDTRTRQ